MQYGISATKMVSINQIHLYEDNPRHKPVRDQPAAIAHLCRSEQVLALAQDIARIGLNPLELFALVPERDGKSYYVAEGNRRLCALLLLNDPDRAPGDQREGNPP